jgi:hypothetical protein
MISAFFASNSSSESNPLSLSSPRRAICMKGHQRQGRHAALAAAVELARAQGSGSELSDIITGINNPDQQTNSKGS